MFKLFSLLLCLPCLLCARQIDTFYGPIEVEEPALLELIDSPAFQRLKEIHQYGVSYYTTFKEEYTRYDHSVGVFMILRSKGAPLVEQIAGLLHDVSHTAFSHVGDWVFGIENQEKDYQTENHAVFLEESGLADILRNHHFTPLQILPKAELFPALECSLPNLCADRIDYNIQGAFHQGFITRAEAMAIFEDIHFTDNRWVSTRPELMTKLTLFSLFMTEHCWGSPANWVTSRWLADAIVRGIEVGCISMDELHHGTDQSIWDKLMHHDDPVIKKKMEMLLHSDKHFCVVDSSSDADLVVKSKFRGIDPWIATDAECLRLTHIDSKVAGEYEKVKRIVEKGWPIKIQNF